MYDESSVNGVSEVDKTTVLNSCLIVCAPHRIAVIN
ncbi:hypothetical protein NIG5292_01758 [Nereida ignava]|uniref:Uncharacterized protein n=1 Tax=Nereida ignava TaxID=282199 RepID=A0A0U1NLW3_9RHOB|nr:hypothetical protein NIG5292_01758 [Nereida ignava]